MIPFALWIQFLELAAWLGIYRSYSHAKRREILLYARPQPQKIVILDSKLKALAGRPNRVIRKAAHVSAVAIRRAANTQALEYVLLMILNHKSKLYSKPQKVVVHI